MDKEILKSVETILNIYRKANYIRSDRMLAKTDIDNILKEIEIAIKVIEG